MEKWEALSLALVICISTCSGFTCARCGAVVILALLLVVLLGARRSTATPCKRSTSSPKAVAVLSDVEAPRETAGWTVEEHKCVLAMLALLKAKGLPCPANEQLFQVAWSRLLQPEAAADLWEQHIEAISALQISAVGNDAVARAYASGFCEHSGKDVQGRPMIWVRMSLVDIQKMTPQLAVRNTWLAQDATLRHDLEANRKGLCFVYDLKGVGRRNLSFSPVYLHQALWGATSHPMHVSRIWLLDAPSIFLVAWRVGHRFLPQHVREAVRFTTTGDRGDPSCFAEVCKPKELPHYLGGVAARRPGSYAEWMFERLKGAPLRY